MSIADWMDTGIVVYNVYTQGIIVSHKREEIVPFVTTWVGLEDIMLGEVSQAE